MTLPSIMVAISHKNGHAQQGLADGLGEDAAADEVGDGRSWPVGLVVKERLATPCAGYVMWSARGADLTAFKPSIRALKPPVRVPTARRTASVTAYRD